jgi:tetratricopeptide (TPR) repeat protein
VLLQLGRTEQADSVLAVAQQLDPANAEVCFLLGVAHRETGRLEESEVMLRRALDLRPRDERTLFELGVLLERMDRADEAAAVFDQVLEIDPSNAVARNYLGFMLADRGIRLQESLAHLEIAVAQEPSNGYYLDSLGWVHYRLGDLREATELLERAVALVDIAPIRAHLAEVYERQGMIPEARANWRRAVALEPDNAEWGKRLEALGDE